MKKIQVLRFTPKQLCLEGARIYADFLIKFFSVGRLLTSNDKASWFKSTIIEFKPAKKLSSFCIADYKNDNFSQ